MAPAGTHIEANGLRIYYEVHGEGEPLLLVHGGTATSQAWASHLPAFTEHFQVFTLDSRGHGRTDNPTGVLDYRLMADDVAALIKALRRESAQSDDAGQTRSGSRRKACFRKPDPRAASCSTLLLRPTNILQPG